MKSISVKDIIEVTGGKLISGSDSAEVLGAAIDSRKVKDGNLFIAIPGEKTDGHNYLGAAEEAGAKCALVSRDMKCSGDMALVLVKDTVEALQRLSKWYLRNLSIKKIAVTGSVGKTTTRDLVHEAVSSIYVSGKNSGNYNNTIGLPLTVMNFTPDMEVGVMEMGTMGSFGEIRCLADIGRPDVAIITNIGVSHMETLGSRGGILKTKMEVTEFFDDKNTLIINYDDDKLASIKDEDYEFRIVRVSLQGKEEADYKVISVNDRGIDGLSFSLMCPEGNFDIEMPIPGMHNALNAALAIAGANAVGVSTEDAISGMQNMITTGNRLKIIDGNNFRLIDDSYNAAPVSMKSALTTLINSKAERRIAILGDMNELGEDSSEMHREVGRFMGNKDIDLLITIGEKARDIADGARSSGCKNILSFDTQDDAYIKIKDLIETGDLILVKASRGMELDKLVQRIVG